MINKHLSMKIKDFPTSVGMVLSLLIFSLLAVYVPGVGSDDRIKTLLGTTTFMFGVIVAFFISQSTSRLNALGDVLNSDDANMVKIYRMARIFGKQVQNKVRNLLDEYLIAQIDYYLEDYEYSGKAFERLCHGTVSIKPNDTTEQSEAYKILLELVNDCQENRTKVISLVKRKLLASEWVITLTLMSIILFSIFYLNDGAAISIIISVLLATAMATILLVLEDLNSLRWKEHSWIWVSLRRTFLDVGLLPYYPNDIIKKGRAKVEKGDRIRVAYYSRPYPDMRGKKIKSIIQKA